MAMDIINWLEIPVGDMVRARKFYESVFEMKLRDMEVAGVNYPCLPTKNGDNVCGALIQDDLTSPGKAGPLVYLNAAPSIDAMIQRIELAGGKITVAKQAIGEGMGYMAIFEDTEGNRLALQGDA